MSQEIVRRNILSECEFSISCTLLLHFCLCCLTFFLRGPFLLSLSLGVEWWPFEIALDTSLLSAATNTHARAHTHTNTLRDQVQGPIPTLTGSKYFSYSSKRDWKCNGWKKWGKVTRKLEAEESARERKVYSLILVLRADVLQKPQNRS